MSNTLTIALRELRSSFSTPLAYVLIAGFSLLSGFFFFSLLSNFNVQLMQTTMLPNVTPSLNEWVITPFYQTLEIVLVFLVPLITMRTIAEEKKTGTFEILITSPVSAQAIVLGKFLGAATIVVLMLLLSFLYPLVLILFADPEKLPALVGLLGMVLFALSFVAIGIAVSAFSKSQTVAGVIGLVAMLIFYVLDAPAQMIGGNVAEVLRVLAPSNHAQNMLKGVITGTDLVYFISIGWAGLFLANRALDAERWR